jgi:cytochrome b subunit of formate dehydrogenase
MPYLDDSSFHASTFSNLLAREITETMPWKKVNYYLLRINRCVVWVLLVLMILFIVTGYGMTRPLLIDSWTRGLIDYRVAHTLHVNLDMPLFALFLVHILIEVWFTALRWGVQRQRLVKYALLLFGAISVIAILYLNLS